MYNFIFPKHLHLKHLNADGGGNKMFPPQQWDEMRLRLYPAVTTATFPVYKKEQTGWGLIRKEHFQLPVTQEQI